MNKYVFFDIDNTLWDENLKFPESTAVAIDKVRKNGNRVFLNTGRSRANIDLSLFSPIEFDGIIAACGNHIEINGRLLHEKLLSQDTIRKSLQVFKENHMPVVMEGPEYMWLNPEEFTNDPYAQILWERLEKKARKIPDTDGEYCINKFSADIVPECDLLDVKNRLGEEMDFLVHGKHVVECIPKNTSKASGIQWMMDQFKIAPEDIYAVGDSINDLDMISFVQHGIAMGNGKDIIKKKAEFVTADLWEDGIYKAMEHYHLF